jgi:glycosyltransferase involved in cell wall biosynthesis
LNSSRALFVQATQPAAYPPLINASILIAEAGWNVTFLSAPSADNSLALSPHPRIEVEQIAERPSHVMTKGAYLVYCVRAIELARSLRPKVVYASDPIGTLPGLLAAKACGARLIYHEHDTPTRESELNPIMRITRKMAARQASHVVFPNAERACIAQADLFFDANRLEIVWNTPRLAELPPIQNRNDGPLIVYYHGSISPTRLPKTVAEAVVRLGGGARLRIAGYETESGRGHINTLRAIYGDWHAGGIIDYIGVVQRSRLLAEAAKAHIGIALMPMECDDINMRHMTGASNKAFEYMAAGLALLVSDLPDWHTMFVETGYAAACDPRAVDSVEAALRHLAGSPTLRSKIAARARTKIEQTWNYDAQFANILTAIESNFIARNCALERYFVA